jgi:hypothetical protein
MTGSTKILTVSYGTFSCTLEGFDDPFGTMRGIAEYFRDLAADDRYFGAEPPTPDVEMLQRIAEKEVQRRVEARLADTGIALTQVTELREDDVSKTETPAPEAVKSAPKESPPTVQTDASDYDHGPLAHDDEYLLSDEPEDVLAVDPDARIKAEGPAETVAEKLRRIRAVVSRSIEPEADEDDRSFSDPQALSAGDQDAGTPKKRALTETIRQITADLSDEDLASEGEDEDEEEDEPETIRVAASTLFEDQTDEEDPDIAHRDDGWDFDTEGLAASAEPEAEPDTEEDVDTDSASDETLISKIMSRGTDVAADKGDKAFSDDIQASQDDQRRTSKPLSSLSEENGDVGRLLAETDNHLKDDEGIRRRRVISQMRAAVAATKADRLVSRRVLTPEEEVAAEQERYRVDLKEVVREVSRPLPGKEQDRRASVAPLVLVSSQRVDKSAASAPVHADKDTTDTGDFVGFAKDMGARELPELLEAAAAYASFVEGQPSFTRPEIMRRVARLDPTLRLSREDGLRSFGQLLRQGTFRKLERGQFTIADTTRFKPDRRIAGE